MSSQKDPTNNKTNSTQSTSKPDIDHIPEQTHHHNDSISATDRARRNPSRLTPRDILQLQRTIGNEAVNRLVSKPQRASSLPITKMSDATASTIQMARFQWTSGKWLQIDGGQDDELRPVWRGSREGEIYDTDEKRQRRKRKHQSNMVGDEVDEQIADNPEAFGLAASELDAFNTDLKEAENQEDDSGGASRHGMSGSARSDKGDAALTKWFLSYRPNDSQAIIEKLFQEYEPMRHSSVNRDDVSTSSRIPNQGQALSYLPEAALKEFASLQAMLEIGTNPKDYDARQIKAKEIFKALQKNVSANAVLGHTKAEDGLDRQGYEILHMAGRAVGDPTIELPADRSEEVYGAEPPSMKEWTEQENASGVSFTPPQHPLNLAFGTSAANTLMMALEGEITKVKGDFTLVTRAYAPRGLQHYAAHIIMTLIHNPTGEERDYYIDGTADIAPIEVYRHMKADAHHFIQTNQHSKNTITAYEYPTIDEVLSERDRAKETAKASGKGSVKKAKKMASSSAAAVDQIQDGDQTLHLNITAGGGNCFFHAVYEARNDARSDADIQQVMRENVIEQFRQIPALANTHFGGVNTAAFQDFAVAILTEGTWAADQTPAMVADALRIQIVIHNPDGSIYFDAQPNAALVGPAQATVHISYDGAHYASFTQAPLQ